MASSTCLLVNQEHGFGGAFNNLKEAGELFDVTLACEDETFEAHKVILSASSPFFRKVLSRIKQNHPYIYLKGILHRDLVKILDFIYTGEVTVATEDVSRFLETGEELSIKWLTTSARAEVEPLNISDMQKGEK